MASTGGGCGPRFPVAAAVIIPPEDLNGNGNGNHSGEQGTLLQ